MSEDIHGNNRTVLTSFVITIENYFGSILRQVCI